MTGTAFAKLRGSRPIPVRYGLAKQNDGAPGTDGVTFEAIEAGGVEGFLDQLREELVQRRYRPQRPRKVGIPKEGGKVRQLSIPSIAGTSRLFRHAHDPGHWTGAASGGLDSDPAVRIRGADPHLLCSTAAVRQLRYITLLLSAPSWRTPLRVSIAVRWPHRSLYYPHAG
jgi:hypothetical protein